MTRTKSLLLIYFRDDETSIIDQLNGTDYKINPDKYVRADSYLKCMKNDNEINSVLFLTGFGQNLTLQSLAIKTPESYNNKLQGLFQNSFMVSYDKFLNNVILRMYGFTGVTYDPI